MVGCWTRKRLLVLLALLEVSALLFATRLLIRAQPRAGSFHDGESVGVPSSLRSTLNIANDSVTAAAPDLRKRNDALLVEPSSLEVQRLVDLVSPRAFPIWNNRSVPLPCPQAETDWTTFRAQRSKTRTGILFVKVPKTGSSTGASVNLRIASRIYQRTFAPLSSGANSGSLLLVGSRNETSPVELKRQNRRQKRRRQQQHVDNQRRGNWLGRDRGPPLCKNRVQHANTRSMGYDQRHKSKSVLWTVVRDPTDRVVSEFFHFHVSRRGRNATDDAVFWDYVRARRTRFRNFQVSYLSLRKVTTRETRNVTSTDANDDEGSPAAHRYASNPEPGVPSSLSSHPQVSVDTIRSIFRDYDFVGVSERMDESLVALQLLLGLEAADVLHMSSKVSGGYDDGLFQDRCVYIQPSFRTPAMQDFFSGSAWRRWTKWDAVLHRAANRSLDLTIESYGAAAFRDHLEAFRDLQRRVNAACSRQVRFPCDASRHDRPRRPSHETDCLLGDMGCGFGCIDQHAAVMGRL